MPDAIDWYFDFVSPFAYLQAEILARDPLPLALRCKPVLFAGLLQHWGQLGPAEVDAKRRFTFRHCLWRAGALGIPMKFPPAHPFNPLSLLRLAIALDAKFDACLSIFRFVFRDGLSADDPQAWSGLIDSLGLLDARERIASEPVKHTLRHNGEEALSRGVFGVPTLAVGSELFWGADATDMCRDFLSGAALFSSAEMLRLDDLPQAARRTVRRPGT
jgi:2-hydroxychromene-2-carboxylate isomerase